MDGESGSSGDVRNDLGCGGIGKAMKGHWWESGNETPRNGQ